MVPGRSASPSGVEVLHIFLGPAPEETPTPPGEDGDRVPESGYDASRRNAITHGMRCQTVFPDAMAALMEERTVTFTAEMRPRSTFETWVIGELARATVQVEVGTKRLLEDEVRIINRVSGPGWAGRCQRGRRPPCEPARPASRTGPPASSRGPSKEQIYLSIISRAWPMPLGARTRWMTPSAACCLISWACRFRFATATGGFPAAGDGPALVALIEQELARHRANLSSTLNQRDRDDQLQAMKCPSTYIDKTRRQLRSDEARALKRLAWAKDAWDQLRSGVAASSIIDPRTRQPIDPKAQDAPARNLPPPRPHPHRQLPLRKRRRNRLRLRLRNCLRFRRGARMRTRRR